MKPSPFFELPAVFRVIRLISVTAIIPFAVSRTGSANPPTSGFIYDPLSQTFTTLNADAPNASRTELYGINNSGEIVGDYIDDSSSPGVVHAFLYDGTFHYFDFGNDKFTQAFGINDSGQIVGVYNDANQLRHGFLATLKPDGSVDTFQTIDNPGSTQTPGLSDTIVNGINNSARVVGSYHDDSSGSPGKFLGFSSDPNYNVFNPIDAGGEITSASDINDAGKIAGVAAAVYDPSAPYYGGFVDDNGTFTFFRYPVDASNSDPDPYTTPKDINNAGTIVGRYNTGGALHGSQGGISHGFIRDANGNFTTLDHPDASQTVLRGINDAGVIVGDFYPNVNPFPDTGSPLILLALSSLGLFGVCRRG